MQHCPEIIVYGCPICRGIAIGKPFFLNRKDFAIFEMRIPQSRMHQEIERYRDALFKSRQDIKRLQNQLEKESAPEGVLILEAQLEMLQDPLLTTEMEKEIKKNKKNVEFVLQQTLLKYQERFKSINNAFFAERFQDLEDLSRRIFSYLSLNGNLSLNDIPAGSIVCTQELTASDAAGAHSFCVGAFVTESGGVTSHAAIVAKGKGIPCVTNVNLEALKGHTVNSMIVDGRTGKVILNPTSENLRIYEELKDRMHHQFKTLEKVIKWPAETFDGYSIRLSANLDRLHETELIHDLGGHGVGLFRSEYIFHPGCEFPSEDEQTQIYKSLVQRMNGLPVVIRTFDFGGDKAVFSQSLSSDRNSFLHSRSTRFLLKEQALFKVQLRAILRASIHGDVRVLFPMISTLPELRMAKRLVLEAREELGSCPSVPIGCMIEVPSAAMVIDHFAKECDFLSIGTNDLVQYTLAIDRSEQVLNGFYDPTDPSIIRMIKLVTSEANKVQIPVSVCGEIASDPRFTALLLGLGIQELSVSPRYLPLIKNAIRRTSIVEAVQIAEMALNATTAQEVLEIIVNDYRKNCPDDLFYNSLECVL